MGKRDKWCNERWNENFEEARRFRKEHGRWPNCNEGAPGRWCHTQRQARKGKGHNRITAAQIAKLDAIGFPWILQNTWGENFEEALRFRDEHGRWPKSNEGPPGRWCNNQRQARKGNGTHKISPARIARLDGVGFDWDPSAKWEAKVEERWNEYFEALKRFRDDHGRWPKAKEGALGWWCNRQRQARKGNGPLKISPEQIAKLDEIGFPWDVLQNELWNASAFDQRERAYILSILCAARASTRDRRKKGRAMCDVGIAVEDFFMHWKRIGGRCQYTNLPLKLNSFTAFQASLDRRDNDVGYNSFYHPDFNPDGNVMLVILELNTGSLWNDKYAALCFGSSPSERETMAPTSDVIEAVYAEMLLIGTGKHSKSPEYRLWKKLVYLRCSDCYKGHKIELIQELSTENRSKGTCAQ